MAAPRKRKAKVESSPLTVTLQDIRLRKFSLQVLMQVEDAGKGSMVLGYSVSIAPTSDINSHAAILRIEGKGVNKEDPAKIAFTVDAEMMGIFSLSRKPIEKELEGEMSIRMANFIAPVLADTIETAMIKAGYPRLKIPRSLP